MWLAGINVVATKTVRRGSKIYVLGSLEVLDIVTEDVEWLVQ